MLRSTRATLVLSGEKLKIFFKLSYVYHLSKNANTAIFKLSPTPIKLFA